MQTNENMFNLHACNHWSEIALEKYRKNYVNISKKIFLNSYNSKFS